MTLKGSLGKILGEELDSGWIGLPCLNVSNQQQKSLDFYVPALGFPGHVVGHHGKQNAGTDES